MDNDVLIISELETGTMAKCIMCTISDATIGLCIHE